MDVGEVSELCDGQTPEQLEAVERYLSAHLVTKGGTTGASGVLKSATRLNVAETYDTDSEAAQDAATRFVNAAASFDHCGIVAERWLGKKRARVAFLAGFGG